MDTINENGDYYNTIFIPFFKLLLQVYTYANN